MSITAVAADGRAAGVWATGAGRVAARLVHGRGFGAAEEFREPAGCPCLCCRLHIFRGCCGRRSDSSCSLDRGVCALAPCCGRLWIVADRGGISFCAALDSRGESCLCLDWTIHLARLGDVRMASEYKRPNY